MLRKGVEMKVIAMYLPQFYRVKENDKWWGEGFTDWVSTQKATKLFDNHYQPHVPLNNYYYDLLQKNTMNWQADLMKQYGIDGVCIYHYWFKNGRQILEKPAENLLSWKDVDMPYCFCWANETWARSWAQIQDANVWTDINENNRKECGSAILLEQQYGDKIDWRQHFEYLNQFFCDERYIKIEGKPVFVLYKASIIPCLNEMITFWQYCAKQAGWNGIYIIGGECKNVGINCLDAEFIHEPRNAMGYFEKEFQKNGVARIDYEQLWKCILNDQQNPKRKTYYWGVVGYDDSPRRGIRGCVLEGNTPELFELYMTKLLAKSESEKNDMVFVNAWNEWGEGMHLEPDERYKFDYLNALKNAKENYKNMIYKSERSFDFQKIEMLQNQSNKFELYMNTLDLWLQIVEKGISIEHFFLEKHYRRIGLYGYGILGKHFINEMENTSISIQFLVDRQKNKISLNIPVYEPTDNLPNCDVIVVSSFFYFDEIKEDIGDKCKLISLQEIINRCAEMIWNS